MSKPEDIPQDVWDSADDMVFYDPATENLDGSLNRYKLRESIARAVLSAEKRGEEREREACAVAAEERHRIWGTTVQVQGIEVEDDISACAEIAAAIRARSANVNTTQKTNRGN